MKKHRFGIIGLGVMGQDMAATLAAHPRFEVAAGFDPAAPHVPFPLLANAAAVVNDPSVDAIYTATPPKVHESIVRLAAQARKPILCEKPLAHDIASARACRDIAAAAGIPAAVNFHFAARDAAVRLGRVVQSGQLGQVQRVHLHARFQQWPRSWQAGAGAWLAGPEEGGFTREVVSHYVFLANRLFGDGTLQQAEIKRGADRVEMHLAATISQSGLPFTIDAGIGGNRDDDIRFSVTGTHSEVALVDWQRLDYAGDTGTPLPPTAPLDMLAEMLDGKPHHLASLDEGCQVVELIESMLG